MNVKLGLDFAPCDHFRLYHQSIGGLPIKVKLLAFIASWEEQELEFGRKDSSFNRRISHW